MLTYEMGKGAVRGPCAPFDRCAKARHHITVALMAGPEGTIETRFKPQLSEIRARQMGELQRGESQWDVLLETAKDAEIEAIRGRIHFVSGNTHLLSGWIFLEWSEKEIDQRFSGFSAQEWWNLLKSLGGE